MSKDSSSSPAGHRVVAAVGIPAALGVQRTGEASLFARQAVELAVAVRGTNRLRLLTAETEHDGVGAFSKHGAEE